MPSNPNNTTPVLTPGGNLAPSQQTNPPGAVPYIENGLTYQSNNPEFVERDDNGNIIVNQGATDNQNLVLEATSLRYVNASVIRNIDTRFKYFRFPAENVAIPDISFEGFDIDDLVLGDFVYAKYAPSEDRPALSTTTYSGILMNQVLAGQQQGSNTNAYTITPGVKEVAVDGIRMRIQLRHRYSETGIDLGNSRREVSGTSISYTKEDYSNLRTEVQDRLRAASFADGELNEDDWWNGSKGNNLVWFNQLILQGESRDSARTIYLGGNDLGGEAEADEVIQVWDDIRAVQDTINKGTIFFSLIKRTAGGDIIRDFRELTVDAGNSTAFINANTTKVSEYDIIIPAIDFQVGDQFIIGVLVGQVPIQQDPLRFPIPEHTILSDGSVWSITDASKNVDIDNNEII